MTTLVDALIAIIDAQWGNGGGGGAEPTVIAALTDYRTFTVARTTTDHIYCELQSVRRPPVNNVYENVVSRIAVTVITATSDTRLKEIADELRWICNNVAVTGVSYQHVVEERDITDRAQKVFGYTLTVECIENCVEGATAYAAPSVLYDVRAALMLGSANAAYVPCLFELESAVGKVVSGLVTITNVDDTDVSLVYNLPLPPVKGTLKLYVSAVKVGLADADAGDYITRVLIRGTTFNTTTTINDVTTDYTSAQAITQTFTAVDCSGYDKVFVIVYLICTNAGDVDVTYCNLRCYYDT